MEKKILIEQVVTATFLLCVVSFFFYGGKYFAGFQYASPADEKIMTVIVIIFHLCLLYYVYRFLEWLVRRIKKHKKT